MNAIQKAVSSEFVALMRRYCFDYTNRQDFSVCDEIMTPDYTLHMGTFSLSGRDIYYKPASRRQFEQFPGLTLTVNELITNGDRLLLRFSEHGASMRHGGALASWGGIGMYRWNGERLTENYVEQDYFSRNAQLDTGMPCPVENPAIAPWDVQPVASNREAEQVVRAMLVAGELIKARGIVFDDEWAGGESMRVLRPLHADIDDLFSAGDKVAFRITQHGFLDPDFPCEGAPLNQEVILHMTGVVTVRDGAVVEGRVVRDRLGLYRRLRNTKASHARKETVG